MVKLKRKDPNKKHKRRDSIRKKNRSKRSYGTQTTIKISSNSNLLKTKFLIVKAMFKLFNWKERFETKILALVSLDLDERAKSYEGLKFRG